MIWPSSYLYDLVDLNEVEWLRNITPSQSPIVWIYDEMLEWWSPSKYPRTIEWTKSYLKALTSTICWARHERSDNGITVHNCKMRECNIACLHWTEFTRHPDWHIQFWTDMWSTRVFATAYVLDKLWYTVPVFLENFWEIHWEMRKYDNWDMNSSFDDKMHPDKNPETEDFQRRIWEEFKRKYINPIKAQFELFWDNQVNQS